MKLLIIFLIPINVFAWDFELNTDNDADNVLDEQDNCIEVYNPPQRDTNVNGIGNYCDGDHNNNGFVDGPDFGLFAQKYGQAGIFDQDYNGDGIVAAMDFSIFASQMWGKPVGKSAWPKHIYFRATPNVCEQGTHEFEIILDGDVFEPVGYPIEPGDCYRAIPDDYGKTMQLRCVEKSSGDVSEWISWEIRHNEGEQGIGQLADCNRVIDLW